MHAAADIRQFQETGSGTDLTIRIPNLRLGNLILQKHVRRAEIRFDDGRHISVDQRKKAYATIKDIADYTGYLPEEQKEWLKYLHICRTGDDYFSLSNCSMDTAREFINTILEFAIEEGIPLSESGLERTDDIGRYLYFCIKNKKCAVCGKPGEIHHEDAIGMGNDRRKTDDSQYRKICLCRYHHTIAHERGRADFQKMYRIYGIIVREEEFDNHNNTAYTGDQKEQSADSQGWRKISNITQ